MKKLIIDKSNEPNEKGNYVVRLNIEKKHSSLWTILFKGTYKECCKFKKEYNKC